jgi:ferritin
MILFNATKAVSRRLVSPIALRCVSSSVSSGQSAQAIKSDNPRYGCKVDGCDSNAPIKFYRRIANLTTKSKYDEMLNAQIGRELAAADFYMALAYKFRHHDLSRPNFAQLMDAKCEEERGHAKMVADFQVGRMGDVKLVPHAAIDVSDISSIRGALERIIEVEISLTRELQAIVKYAENGEELGGAVLNDDDILIDPDNATAPHIADYIQSEFLPEQQKDVYELRCLLNRLKNFKGECEVLFDASLVPTE